MKIAIIGFGSRGSLYANLYGSDATLAAVCDIKNDRLALAKDTYKLANERLYISDKDFFAQDKLADLLIVSSPDACHKEHALAALQKGYDIQLEKPIACTEEDCRQIYRTAKALSRKVFVCHVLRYAPFFSEIKRELDSGNYGNPVTINLTENVAYWHQAHSYVRGNWRNSGSSSPMIIAKSCHDLDILAWLAGKPCKTVSSMGSLSYYNKEHAPEGSAQRCLDCPVKKDCAYDAEEYYIGQFNKGNSGWPVNILAANPTKEKLLEELKSGPYGRCVYKCDNNAVDHQIVNMLFESNITAHLTMTAFSQDSYREIHVHCENGEIYGNMQKNILVCNIFGKGSKTIDISSVSDSGFGHGGGDLRLVKDILASYSQQKSKSLTSIENSMISHIIGFAAENSRLNSGAAIEIKL